MSTIRFKTFSGSCSRYWNENFKFFFSKYFCQNIFRNKISINKLCPQAVLKQNSNILICYKSIRIESGLSLPLSLRWVWVESVLSQFWVWIESGLSLNWVWLESGLSLFWLFIECGLSELSMPEWAWIFSKSGICEIYIEMNILHKTKNILIIYSIFP